MSVVGFETGLFFRRVIEMVVLFIGQGFAGGEWLFVGNFCCVSGDVNERRGRVLVIVRKDAWRSSRYRHDGQLSYILCWCGLSFSLSKLSSCSSASITKPFGVLCWKRGWFWNSLGFVEGTSHYSWRFKGKIEALFMGKFPDYA